MSTSSLYTRTPGSDDGLSQTTVIVLSTALPVALIIAVVAVLYFWYRKRRFGFLIRGITPIADEEIESWKTEKAEEATPPPADGPRRHQPSMSASSIQKPASIIVYQRDAQYTTRPSVDRSPRSPGLPLPKSSIEVPAPVLALAPNARPGLTDEMIQGDEAFVPRVKRQPSRLAKGRHQHSRSTMSQASAPNSAHDWYGSNSESEALPRHSTGRRPRTPPPQSHGHKHVYSSPAIPPRHSFDDDVQAGGLSPRPLLHKSDIGRAIG